MLMNLLRGINMPDGVTKATHNQYMKCEHDNPATGILKCMFTVYSKIANIRIAVAGYNNAAEMLA
jgi:hypothetical protein